MGVEVKAAAPGGGVETIKTLDLNGASFARRVSLSLSSGNPRITCSASAP